MDIIASATLELIAVGTWLGFEIRTVARIFVASEVMIALLLAVALLGTAISTRFKHPIVWLLFVVSQCLVAIQVLFTFVGPVYVLVGTWHVSNMMWTGGDPQSLTFATLVFIFVETLTLVPIVILVRNQPKTRHG